jgi:predicted Zn-dependent peptidase
MPSTRLQKTLLSSGIRVLTEAVPGVRSVSLGIWIDNGSRDESPRQRGLSHFLEHMLFKGIPGMNAREVAEAFDELGADINAVTGREHTAVYSRVTEEFLARVIEIASDMVIRPTMEKRDIDAERQVVLEEINMHNDSPDELVHDYLAKTMWGEHPIGHSVLGEGSVIRDVDADILSEFMKERYVASRMVVAAAGSVDHESICEMIQGRLVQVMSGDPSVRDDSLETPLAGTTIENKPTEQAHITIGSRGLPKLHPDRFALAVADNIVGGSMSSRLFQRIREEKGLVYSIYSFSSMFIGMGIVGIYCGTHPSQAQTVIDLVAEEISRAVEYGFTARELERARKHIKGSLIISLEDSSNRMNRMAKAELAGGEHLSIDELVEKVEAVSLEDLERVMRETWGGPRASLAVIGPFSRGELILPRVIAGEAT